MSDKPWTEALHRDFISAVYDVGMAHSSPSVILENMQNAQGIITNERVKSHLQKYRLNRQKAKEEFLVEHDRWMAKVKSLIGNLDSPGKKSSGNSLRNRSPAAIGNLRQLLEYRNLLSGQVAAYLSFAIMMEDRQRMRGNTARGRTRRGNPNYGDSEPEEDLALDLLAATVGTPNQHHEESLLKLLSTESVTMPVISDAEKNSSLGKAMMCVVKLLETIHEHVESTRAAARLQEEESDLGGAGDDQQHAAEKKDSGPLAATPSNEADSSERQEPSNHSMANGEEQTSYMHSERSTGTDERTLLQLAVVSVAAAAGEELPSDFTSDGVRGARRDDGNERTTAAESQRDGYDEGKQENHRSRKRKKVTKKVSTTKGKKRRTRSWGEDEASLPASDNQMQEVLQQGNYYIDHSSTSGYGANTTHMMYYQNTNPGYEYNAGVANQYPYYYGLEQDPNRSQQIYDLPRSLLGTDSSAVYSGQIQNSSYRHTAYYQGGDDSAPPRIQHHAESSHALPRGFELDVQDLLSSQDRYYHSDLQQDYQQYTALDSHDNNRLRGYRGDSGDLPWGSPPREELQRRSLGEQDVSDDDGRRR